MQNENAVPAIRFRIGKRLYLRPVLKDDIPFITAWINDPEITKFLKVNVPMTPEDEMKWFESISAKKPNDIVFAIVLKENDEMIGVMGLHHVNFLDGLARTGSFIGVKDYWSKGYGTEAKMLVLEYAFNTLNLRKVCSAVYDFNGRSKKCLEKCGYHEEGCWKSHAYRNGSYHDLFQMAVFKEDFLPLWEKFNGKVSAE